MAYDAFVITHSRDGFSMWRETGRSHFKDWLVGISDSLCKASGHRFCHLFGKLWNWSEKNIVIDKRTPISDEVAYALSEDDDWRFVTRIGQIDDSDV